MTGFVLRNFFWRKNNERQRENDYTRKERKRQRERETQLSAARPGDDMKEG